MRSMNFAFLLASIGLGCGEHEIIYQDRPVVFDYDPDEVFANQERMLLPGVYEEQLFNAIEDGDDLHIVAGFQGGIWVHLSLRVTGMRSRGQIQAEINPDIGSTDFSLKLLRTADGFLEAYDIPIPVGDRGSSMADIEALFGRAAVLRVRYTVDEVTIEAERRVILRPG